MTFEMQAKKVGLVHLNAKIDALAEMLIEIEEEDYNLVGQVKGAITSRIELLASIKESDEN